jgi:hypothetical protein
METSAPIQFNIKKSVDEVSPAIEQAETEDQKIGALANDVRWVALKERLERKIKAANDSATITQNTVEAIDNMEEYGFKCALRDLLVEAYQGVIDDVEETAKVLKAKEDGAKTE